MRLCMLCASLALMLFVPALQAAQQPIDGPHAVLADPLLDKMVGDWTMNGKLMGQSTTHTVKARWVLNHQFLEIHEWGPSDPKTATPQYEAMPMIGYDNMSERYVLHWIDVFGGRFSETLGYGKRVGNEIDFIFEYPDGPFRTNLSWDATRGQWHWQMTRKNTSGQWATFADLTLSHAERD
jgi:hypothetical protein